MFPLSRPLWWRGSRKHLSGILVTSPGVKPTLSTRKVKWSLRRWPRCITTSVFSSASCNSFYLRHALILFKLRLIYAIRWHLLAFHIPHCQCHPSVDCIFSQLDLFGLRLFRWQLVLDVLVLREIFEFQNLSPTQASERSFRRESHVDEIRTTASAEGWIWPFVSCHEALAGSPFDLVIAVLVGNRWALYSWLGIYIPDNDGLSTRVLDS